MIQRIGESPELTGVRIARRDHIGLKGDVERTAAALLRLRLVPFIGEKIVERPEKE